MATIKQIMTLLDEFAPFDSQESWDNCALSIGDENREVKRILLCLDVTHSVALQAVNGGYDLIISHHPKLFTPIKSIVDKTVLLLIENRIAVISAHTNLDKAAEGINKSICDLLQLNNAQALKEENGLMWVGEREALALDFLKELEAVAGTKLKTNIGAETSQKVYKAAIISGGGGGDTKSIDYALDHHCQLFITGDVKHHFAIYAREKGILLIEYPHFYSERRFMQDFAAKLTALLNQKSLTAEVAAASETSPLFFVL